MTISDARGWAATAWQHKVNEQKVMDPDLAESFAMILQRRVEEELNSAEFVMARGICEKHLRDSALRQTYRANIAMLLSDQYEITDHVTRNQAAEDILKLIFETR